MNSRAVDRSTTTAVVAIALASGAVLWLQASRARAMPTIERGDAIVALVVAIQAATWLLWSRSTAGAIWIAAQAALVIACGVTLLDGSKRTAAIGVLISFATAAIGRLTRSRLAQSWTGSVAALWIASAMAVCIAIS